MHLKFSLVICVLLIAPNLSAGQHDQSGILKTILTAYYKNEKVVVKGRAQFLFLYCEKANNNEELFETINGLKLSETERTALKNQINADKTMQDWSGELAAIFAVGHEFLKSKVNDCLSLEDYQALQKKSAVNNRRLLIISKPVFYPDAKTALVKVVFYRSIEHNYGSVLLMRKIGDKWEITQQLNPWET